MKRDEIDSEIEHMQARHWAENKVAFWRYVPAIGKPFNPAYGRVWHSMSHRERQKSFLIDVAVVISVAILTWWLS